MTKKSLFIICRQSFALLIANIKSRYRKTIVGFLWVLLNPLLVFSIQCFVFFKILGTQTENYSLFLASGLIPWVFVSQTLEMTVGSFVNHGNLFKSFNLSPLVVLFAQIMEGAINLLFAIIFLVLPIYVYYRGFTLQIIWAPILVAVVYFSLAQLAFCLSYLQVFYRDVRYLLTAVLNISFFLTPIFYNEASVPSDYRWILNVNIFYHFISPFQALFFGNDIALTLEKTLKLLSWNLLLGLVVYFLCKDYRKKIYQYV